jgi:general secretion pathway protein E
MSERISKAFLTHHRICPDGTLPGGELSVAVTEDSLLEGLDAVSVAYDCPVATRIVGTDELDLLLARLTASAEGDVEVGPLDSRDGPLTSDIRDLANQPPVVRYVNMLIREAQAGGASDIHLESTPRGLKARFRIDGVLGPALDPPARLEHAVVSRVKLLADLDIAERRRPQDGRIRVQFADRELDLRISTVPTIFGESVVMRLLERGSGSIALETLGMPAPLLERVKHISRRTHGMILVTGPTGSGKTTTLYAALGLRSTDREKILTLEDPVEYSLKGVTQVPVHQQTGVTFASMLRSMLRQDPDVMLIGEMRDAETAELAIRAALTGHLVFSTLHTNDAAGAIPRLLDLGVPGYLIAATVHAVLAQRLVRCICQHCRENYVPDSMVATLLEESGGAPETYTRGVGCDACRGTGFRGRTGLFELLEINDDVRAAIARDPSTAGLSALALESGMRSLTVAGWAQVRAGVTTVEEVLRVTQQ